MSETVLLCGVAFLGGIVDAVAGGAGLIQIPALFVVFPAAPPALLLGINKLSSIAGTATAAARYAMSVPMEWKRLLPSALLALVSAAAGAWIVSMLEPDALRPLIIILLACVALSTLLSRRLGLTESRTAGGSRAQAAYCSAVGFYDGFFGPGTGSLFIFGFVRWFGRTFLQAAAATKIVNLATNTGALLWFAASGHVDYSIGIPMAIASVAGGYVGAAAAVRHGAGFVRLVFLVVVWALIAKLALDMLR